MNEWLNDFYWNNAFWIDVVLQIAAMVALLVGLLIMIAFLLLLDRKVWAGVGMRRGPNVVGPYGLLQSFADFLKFVFKELVIPSSANKIVYMMAPWLTVSLALGAWAVVPVDAGWVVSNINVGVLYIFAISSLGVYGIIMGGWASNSKYPFLGALRSAAQMVSYEVSIGFVIITVLLTAGSLNLSKIIEAQAGGMQNWYLFSHLFPMAIVFFISALAETNRPPFDLPEAESELVAGYMTEYSSTPYLLFMLGEYANIVLMCAMMSIFFLGGWHAPFEIAPLTWIPGILWFIAKIWFLFFLFAMVKAIVPRYRYDQLMRIGWKFFLPLSMFWVVATAGYLMAFDKLP
ncbi:MAG: NADH-quinone oxidoreductase subunit NuoH [Micropepsaceae bacterium]